MNKLINWLAYIRKQEYPGGVSLGGPTAEELIKLVIELKSKVNQLEDKVKQLEDKVKSLK